MKTAFFSTLIVLLLATFAKGETYCQNVNRTGNVINAVPLAKTMNKWLKLRGVNYKTTPKEITNTIKNFCSSSPHANDEDATNHLNNIVDAMTALKGSIND